MVGTNDMVAWADWAVNAIGLTRRPLIGLSTAARKRNVKIICFCGGRADHAASAHFFSPKSSRREKLWVKIFRGAALISAPKIIDAHLLRLDQHKIPHTDPIRTAAEGDEGKVIYFGDPDGNQYEFWAPAHMPKGAMEICTSEKVGRISHVVDGAGRTE